MQKPKTKDIKWILLYSKNDLEVYGDYNNSWVDYKVKLNKKLAKRFYGETAWMDVTRWVHDQAIEFQDFNLEDSYAFILETLLKELDRR